MAEHTKRLRRWRINYQQTAVYVALVLVVCFSFYLDNKNQKDDAKQLCVSGVETRIVQRSIVEAIYNLATGAVQRDANDPPLTPDEIRQYNAYIERVNNFREDMYNKIRPSEVCAPYVKDDNIKPPSPPTPPIPITKEKAA